MLSTVTNGIALHQALAERFTADDLEWKVQTCGKRDGRIWALVVPYLSARAIQSRLDEVVGPGGWKTRYEPIKKADEVVAFLCYLSIKIDGEWIEKCDGAELTDIESIKGGISNALKRCAVQWGLGRYLYAIPTCWANVHDRGKERGRLKRDDGGDWFNWDPPAMDIAAPSKPQESASGNVHAPRQQTSPAATSSPAASPAPTASASAAGGPATKTPSPHSEPTTADLRGAQQRHAEAKKLLDQGSSADVAQALVTELYGQLKEQDDALATVLWRSVAGMPWTEKQAIFETITYGYRRGIEQWGEAKGLDSFLYFKDEAGWPRDKTAKATREQVKKLADFFATIKPLSARSGAA